MDFTDDAYVLSARPFGETGAIVEALTAHHGRWAAHVAGGASRRLKPILQPGARVQFAYRSRTFDQLGAAALEAAGPGPDALFDDRLALAGLASAAALAQALPEREAHPGAFLALESLIGALADSHVWPAVYVRFEAGLLEEVGFGLDLSRCAATGSRDDLVYVSPRTGRAVSRDAGRPYHDKLLALPPFLLSSQTGLTEGDIAAGLALTGHFLEQFLFAPLNRPLPPARHWLLERLRDAGRL
ncbi:MAG TPA: DNA repair protein RecO [Caulobacteraceae bacterium]|jgi:DNA repair protein RecO (recombination protein O)